MIPEIFKENLNVNVRVFGFEVNVDYCYHWPSISSDGKEPLAVHFEFRSDSKIISSTGYKSHFLFSSSLKYCEYTSIEELCTAIGEHLARENGYEPPEPEQQLSLF
ncbi:hypothetical protein ASU31_00050 [Pedobacter ginsenosidimutans]|uniref:Uncharacterized protein n=1 Tax=Pedobacter ginsenosidimutans TaxID=687842 RepID=A0A0T5VV77_9SPHI|nr:hypothetical protein [Pedobacter ginsenosidimutans]KRT17725.1 hypothetical protein ASU31_00050 [Pedobacter ginsenosidimutans]